MPVYVGSTWDMNGRDYGHTDSRDIPFDRFMAKQGRDKFTLETVDTVYGKTRWQARRNAVPCENKWMDKLETWHGFGTGGMNFKRATVVFDSDENYRGWKAAQADGSKRNAQDPKWLAAKAEENKKKAQDPKWQAANRAGAEKRKQNPEWRAAQAAVLRNLQKDPTFRKKYTVAIRARMLAKRLRRAGSNKNLIRVAHIEDRDKRCAALARLHYCWAEFGHCKHGPGGTVAKCEINPRTGRYFHECKWHREYAFGMHRKYYVRDKRLAAQQRAA